MSPRWMFFSAGSFFFIQFVIFSYLVHKDLLNVIDFNVTVLLQDHVTKRLDTIFSFFSDFGKFEIMTIVLLVTIAAARKFWAGFIALFLYGSLHIIELLGKFMLNHPPPAEFMLRTERVINFPQFHVRSEYSYPSGHAGRALFITMLLVIFLWKSSKIPLPLKIIGTIFLCVYDMVMVVSRVILGEHWFSDIIGGSLLGIALGSTAGILYFAKMRIKHHANIIDEK